MLILDGIITVLFGVAMIIVPTAGLLAWMWMIGAFKLVSGLLLLILAFRLRKEESGTSNGGLTNLAGAASNLRRNDQ